VGGKGNIHSFAIFASRQPIHPFLVISLLAIRGEIVGLFSFINSAP